MAYGEDEIDAAAKALGRLRSALEVPIGEAGAREARPEETAAAEKVAQAAQSAFEAAMDSDFNTSQALAALHDLARETNRMRVQERYPAAALALPQQKMIELAAVLGLDLAVEKTAEARDADPFVELLVELRGKLRAAKQWALADEVRDGLRAKGVTIEDGPEGTIWKYAEKS